MADVFNIKCLEPVVYRYDSDGRPSIMYSCGKCPLCRERKRKQWASRMECEAKYSKSTFFLSLTYSDDHLPFVSDCGVSTDIMTLNKHHYSNFLKKLRKELPFKIRFFGVGEYGKESGRPHYHFIIYCPVFINRNKFRQYVSKCWRFGFNTVKDANVQRFYYIAKYCTKDTVGHPAAEKPFQSCSQKPPIGYQFFRANNDLYRNPSVNYMVSPTFRKCSLPRSFENHIKSELDMIPSDTVSSRSYIRSQIIQRKAGLLLRQYVLDYNNLPDYEFVQRRDEIERRLNKKSYKLNQI